MPLDIITCPNIFLSLYILAHITYKGIPSRQGNIAHCHCIIENVVLQKDFCWFINVALDLHGGLLAQKDIGIVKACYRKPYDFLPQSVEEFPQYLGKSYC